MGLEKFILKEEIMEGKEIKIPEKAKFLRTKSGRVLFYENNGGEGFIEIPDRVSYIAFPDYRRHFGHIYYGLPSFKQSNLNQTLTIGI